MAGRSPWPGRMLAGRFLSAEPTAHHGAECEQCGGSICVILGIVIHVVGSIGINIGQNLQALGLDNQKKNAPAEGKPPHPCSSKTWVVGLIIFAVSSVVTFGALALASATILVPLESVQFIVNILFNRFVRGKKITVRGVGGVGLIMVGIVFFVLFGPNEGVCFSSADDLKAFWNFPSWWIYMGVTFAIGAAFYVLWIQYEAATRAGKPKKYSKTLEPICYTLSSALLGGGQMIVHTKLLGELIEMAFGSGQIGSFFSNWFTWVELCLVILFGGYWLWRLSACLGMYDPLFIIPLMQTAFIIFGAVAGGVYFHEFAKMSDPSMWPGRAVGVGAFFLYGLGLLCAVGGLCLLASDDPDAGDDGEKGSAPADAAGVQLEGGKAGSSQYANAVTAFTPEEENRH